MDHSLFGYGSSTPDENGRLNTSVYRKETHTDLVIFTPGIATILYPQIIVWWAPCSTGQEQFVQNLVNCNQEVKQPASIPKEM